MNLFYRIEGYDQHGLYHPNKIVWRKDISTSSLAETLKSDKRRRVVRTIKKAEEQGISLEWEENISLELFQRFYIYYVQMMQKKEGGRIVLENGWYQDRIVQEQKKFSLISVMQGDLYLGGAIVEQKPTCLDLCYVAYKKFSLAELDLGIGALLIDTVVQQAVIHEYSTIGYGRDTNMYGQMLPLELLRYKRWYGFIPRYAEEQNTYIMQTAFLLQPYESPVALFTQLSPAEKKLECTFITSDIIESIAAYIPQDIPFHVLDMSVVLDQHTRYLEQKV